MGTYQVAARRAKKVHALGILMGCKFTSCGLGYQPGRKAVYSIHLPLTPVACKRCRNLL